MRKNSKKNQVITQMRTKAGLTQTELAQLVGVSENTIANWERGSASKWIGNLIKLCGALNCTLEDLAPEEESQHIEVYDLSGRDIDTVRNYCEAVLAKDHKSSAKIASYATINDLQLRYWLDQADKLIYDFRDKGIDIPDVESLIGGLTLCNLTNRLVHSQSELIVMPNAAYKLGAKQFIDCVEKIRLNQSFIDKYVDLDEENYKRGLIFQNWILSVYVIGWRPGREVPMHHHGNSLDAIRVVQGEMTHWELSEERAHDQNIPFEGIQGWWEEKKFDANSQVYKAGDLVLVDRRTAHKIKNCSNDTLVTLHFRFGAPADDDRWMPDVLTFGCDSLGQCRVFETPAINSPKLIPIQFNN
ncbi:helix-turn-helix domain-containing protein [Nodosilinea sp. LEGE 07088]|uniref:XRE family transcriptional regulator n=1 Tax=Nodosilinea sp. LEGE 07088 TaxID=2777968 RepID=UPI001882C3CD|nr:XRE family transcriptional regulator [Nodosilinea sp. LEGE 07088]MBE9139155.1 helix-turn-helix domain-containing protein [Nodosilinea sp. LEGE 07088]